MHVQALPGQQGGAADRERGGHAVPLPVPLPRQEDQGGQGDRRQGQPTHLNTIIRLHLSSVLCTQVGVAGTMTRLQAQQISDQPVNCLDWSPDKLGLIVTSAFDQRIRIVIITKLNLL